MPQSLPFFLDDLLRFFCFGWRLESDQLFPTGIFEWRQRFDVHDSMLGKGLIESILILLDEILNFHIEDEFRNIPYYFFMMIL